MRYILLAAFAAPLVLISVLDRAASVQARQIESVRERRVSVFERERFRDGMPYRPGPSVDGRVLCFDRDGAIGRNLVTLEAVRTFRSAYCAELQNASFAGADLTRVAFGSAQLGGADLRGAKLDGADLAGADLRDADLWGASMVGARFDRFTRLPFSAAEAEARGMVRSEVFPASPRASLLSWDATPRL